MRLLLTCYCEGDGPHGEDGETIFVSADAPGPFGLSDGDVSQQLSQTVSIQSVSQLEGILDYFRHAEDGYAVCLDTPPASADDDPEAVSAIPHIDLMAESN